MTQVTTITQRSSHRVADSACGYYRQVQQHQCGIWYRCSDAKLPIEAYCSVHPSSYETCAENREGTLYGEYKPNYTLSTGGRWGKSALSRIKEWPTCDGECVIRINDAGWWLLHTFKLKSSETSWWKIEKNRSYSENLTIHRLSRLLYDNAFENIIWICSLALVILKSVIRTHTTGRLIRTHTTD